MGFKRYALAWILGGGAFLATFGGDAQPASVSAATRFAGAVTAGVETGAVWAVVGAAIQGMLRRFIAR